MDSRVLVYADHMVTLVEALQSPNAFAVKCHTPDWNIQKAIHSNGYPLIISIRNPTDCIISYMRQCYLNFEQASSMVIASANIAVDLSISCPHLLIRYETSLHDAKQILEIANYIHRGSSKIAYWRACQLAEANSPTAVQKKIDRLILDGIIDGNDPKSFDPVTHWHPRHLSSGVPEKTICQLKPSDFAAIDDALAKYNKHFRYSLT